MQVLFVQAGNMFGGVERVLQSIACERQTAPSLEPHFALCFEGRLADALRRQGTEPSMLGPVRLSRPDLVWRARRRLQQLIERRRPDAIVTQSAWSHALFAPVARRMGIPLVAWVHDILSPRTWLDRRAGRASADLLVCNSRFTEAAARLVYQKVPVVVVHGPITFAPPKTGRAAVRRMLSTPQGEVVVAHVGRMVPLKGHAALLDALATLSPGLSWSAWIVGGPQHPEEVQYANSLRERAVALGIGDRVRFLGMRDDVPDLLAAADVYCQPNSNPEAFGLSLVEAMAAGLPVIASRLGGAPEAVDGSCGRLVPCGDSAALNAELRSLVESKEARERLGRGGPTRAWALCNPADCLERLMTAVAGIRLGRAL